MFLNQIRCCYRVQRACFNNYRIAINGPGFIAKRWNGRNNNTCCEDDVVKPQPEPEPIPVQKLVEQIQRAQSTAEVLNLIPTDSSGLLEDQIMAIFRAIDKLQSNESTSIAGTYLVYNGNFQALNKQLKAIRHRFSEKHLLELVDIVNSIGLLKYDDFDIDYRLLKLAYRSQLAKINKYQIDDLHLTVGKLRKKKFLDLWTARMISNPLIYKKPDVNNSNLQLQKSEEHCIDLRWYKFRDAIQQPELNDDFLGSFQFKIAKGAIDIELACEIIRAIGNLGEIPECHVDLWLTCLEIFQEGCYELEPKKLSRTIQLIANIYIKNPDLVNIDFLSDASTEVWLCNIPLDVTIELIRSFDRCNYADIFLFRHLNEIFLENKIALHFATPHELFNVIEAFARANEPPDNMEKLWPVIRKNNTFIKWQSNFHWPWPQFIINLAVLNISIQGMTIDAIERAILLSYATVSPNSSVYADILRLYQICFHNAPPDSRAALTDDMEMFMKKAIQINAQQEFAALPLSELITEAISDEYVLTKVVTKYYHCIQHLFIQNVQTKQLMKIDANRFKHNNVDRTEKGFTLLDDIILNENERFLAINQVPDKLTKLNKRVLRGQSALLQKHLECLGLKVLLCPIQPNTETKALISQFLGDK